MSTFIFDKYLDSNKEIKSISKEEVKNIAFTAFYLSSKYDSIVPFAIDNHPLINVSVIKQLEIKILTTLNFNIKHNSSYYYIKYFFCDLSVKNKELIQELLLEKYITSLEKISIAFVKLLTMDVSFYKFNQWLIAIGCMINGINYIMDKASKISTDKNFS